MRHLGTRTLTTPRLTLRRFQEGDAPAIYRGWAHDDAVTRHLLWHAHQNEAETRAVLADWLEAYSRPYFYKWAVALSSSGRLIGTVGVFSIDEEDRRCEVGYCYSHADWGRGYATEALGAVLDFLLLGVGFHRVEACHTPGNPVSGGVLRKCGMRYEGFARQKHRGPQGYFDCHCYAILRQDLPYDHINHFP
jgi:ribosomal-protein-alanine N-acetyltransferase